MFSFLSKFLPQRSESARESNRKKDPVSPLLRSEADNTNKEAERHAYLRRIDASIHSEQTLLELLLQCDFADGRLHAAQHIHTKDNLEKVVKELRNSDKRVAKLMLHRLEQIQKKEELARSLQACVEQAQGLLEQESILANQVIALDKSFSSLLTLSDSERLPFEQLRAQIAERLDQQLLLQRNLLDLQRQMETIAHISQGEFQGFVQQCQQQFAIYLSSPYVASLPKHLLADVQSKLISMQALASQKPPSDIRSQSQNPVEGAVSDELAMAAPLHLERPIVQRVQANLSMAQFEHALAQMEAALEQGSVQIARQLERELKEIDPKQHYDNLKLSQTHKARLMSARKELSHLMSWAKWSGAVSRDELVVTAEGLASLKLKPAEIVETVTALRAQWKQMEGGSAAKELWERFDAACSAAYAPASMHFREQADIRKNNLSAAQTWLGECKQGLESLMNEPISWKAVQSTLYEMQQHWRSLGAIDRKEKLELEKAYLLVCDAPRQALAVRQDQERASRLTLIAEVEALDPGQKSSVDQLKNIQARWQIQAVAIPLKRRDEQELWEKFRAACDAVFEEKRRYIENADQLRQQNLASKLSLCEQAEASLFQDEKEVRQFLTSLKKTWQDIGSVPRQQELVIEKRFEKITSQLDEQAREMTRQKHAQKLQAILQKTALCQHLETQLCEQDLTQIAVQAITQQWQEVGTLSNQLTQVVQVRFDAALAALTNGIDHYRTTLAANREIFDDLMLHVEILAGIESPDNLARERLQKQVQVLQASLKNGNDKSQVNALFKQLLEIPVALDQARQQRWTKLVKQLDVQLI